MFSSPEPQLCQMHSSLTFPLNINWGLSEDILTDFMSGNVLIKSALAEAYNSPIFILKVKEFVKLC